MLLMFLCKLFFSYAWFSSIVCKGQFSCGIPINISRYKNVLQSYQVKYHIAW